jgi:penicillin-binding protein 1A
VQRSSQGLLEPLPPVAVVRQPVRGPVGRRSWFWRYRRVWFLVGILLFTALAGAAWVLTQIPLPPEAPQAQTTVLYDATGAQLATLHGVENRYPVPISKVPPVVTAAVVAAEDRKYFVHGGIDPLGIARATWADIRRKGVMQGGSTITQQYVKNAYVGTDYTLWRKIREAVISVKIERKYDKHQILERYLNTVYFGRGAYGVQAASKAYFNKDVGQLELKEATYLAGLIRSPSAGDVADDPVEAHDLRFIVLEAMVDTKIITPEEANAVEAIPVSDYVVAPSGTESEVTLKGAGAEYFVAYVQRELIQPRGPYTEDQVLRGGMRIHTTLDPTAQRVAYDAVYGLLDRPNDPAGALVSVDNEGRVVAMVGGRDWAASQVNLAVGTDGGGLGRQAGSTFKAIVLAEAMNQGISLEAPFRGPAKIVLPRADKGEDWEVNNYENASFGSISLLDATAESVNTVYAQLVVQVGPAKVVEMAKKMGVKAELNPDASIALGTADVSVLDMASAYLTLQTKGMQVQPRVIRKITQNGSVLVDDRPKSTRVLDKGVADKVNYALQQVVEEGSGTAAALPQAQVWGKTGTTDLYGDAWFVGFTRHLTTAVWMGYPEGQSKPLYNVHGVPKVNGGSLPAQIFKRFMSRASPPDDTPPDKVPNLSGKTLAPVASLVASDSGSSSGSSSGSNSSSGSRSSSSATTVPQRETDEEDQGEAPATTVRPSTAASIPAPAPVVTTQPASTPATAPPTTQRRPRDVDTVPTIPRE